MTAKMKISIVVAVGQDSAIGYRNRLLWHIPADMQRFRALTLGHSVIMGRKTFDSLPHGALPRRRNIVVSRTVKSIGGCEVYATFQGAVEACMGEKEVFVIGGETIYRQALPLAHRICLTQIDSVAEQADAYFPEIDGRRWVQTKKEKHDGFSFIEYVLRQDSFV